MRASLILIALIVLLSGCAPVRKEIASGGGSKADGSVKMAYTVGQFENAVVDKEHAKNLASKKCKAWGYEIAEPFGGSLTQCIQVGAYGCGLSNVTVEYQCIGGSASNK